jgi:hypothetical protein
MNNREEYLRIKRKYLSLKNQIGGNPNKISKLRTIDLYDVIYIDEKKFKKTVEKSSTNIKNTINDLYKLVIELRKLNITSHIVPLPASKQDKYWSDYPFDYLNNVYGDDWMDNQYIFFTVYMDKSGTKIIDKREITADFSQMNKREKEKIINLLNKYLKNQYIWNGKNTDRIMISYKKITNVIDKTKLKDDDEYPKMTLDIRFNDNVNLFKDHDLVDKIITDMIKIIDTKYYSYAMKSISMNFFSIDKQKYKKYFKQIMEYLKKIKNIKSYSIYFYTNEKTMHDKILK